MPKPVQISQLRLLPPFANTVTGERKSSDGLQKIFVSYKKSDNKINNCRDRVIGKIHDLDCAVWVDEFLHGGADYKQEIETAITACQAVILVVTNEILSSDFVWNTEIALAKEQDKPIIPIAFDLVTEKLGEVERRCVKKPDEDHIQILHWPSSKDQKNELTHYDPMKEFDEKLENALKLHVLEAELHNRIVWFFREKRHLGSSANLSPTQQLLRGVGYLRGIEVEKDIEFGLEILKGITDISPSDEALDKTKRDCSEEIGIYYNRVQDDENAILWLEKADSYGYSNNTALLLSDIYGNENSVYHDVEKEEFWLEKLVDSGGCPYSPFNLAYVYSRKEPSKENIRKVKYLLKKSQENARTFYNVGIMYFYGITFEQSYTSAEEFFSRARHLGHVKATLYLAKMYILGIGVEVNTNKALALIDKVVESGDSRAYELLGILLSCDNGKQHKKKALQLLENASSLGESEASRVLGYLYRYGKTVGKNIKKAISYYEKSIAQSGIRAYSDLGRIYLDGEGVKKDYKNAMQLFEKGSAKKDPESMLMLGEMYCQGLGVEQDFSVSLSLTKKLIKRGYSRAMFCMGCHYKNGFGTQKSIKLANRWYEKAKEAGYDNN
jgi:TPR repeat protein